jgi:hypothetical protein
MKKLNYYLCVCVFLFFIIHALFSIHKRKKLYMANYVCYSLSLSLNQYYYLDLVHAWCICIKFNIITFLVVGMVTKNKISLFPIWKVKMTHGVKLKHEEIKKETYTYSLYSIFFISFI